MAAPFVSEAEIETSDPAALAATIVAHWSGYDVDLETVVGRTVARFGGSVGVMEPGGDALRFRLECQELGVLEIMRSSVTEAFVSVGGRRPSDIRWRGHMPTGRLFADFREVTVARNVEIAPRIRRLTFTGDDVARFGSGDDIHVRLYIPPAGLATPEWPRPGEDGRTEWPDDKRRPEVRYYTVRRWRPEANEIDVDFVMHDDEGPGALFAARAAAGDVCGMAGPVGRVAPRAAWTLLAGDETALPAIARMLEEMPREARGAAFVEVDGPQDQIALDPPQGVALRWLHRRGAPAGATELLPQAIASAPLPLEADPFVWAGCEFSAAKTIRRHLKARGLARDRYLVVGYWQRQAEDAAAA